MGIRRQIINASISLHYQIGRLVAGINVAWKSNKNALNIFLSKPIILSRRCVNKTNVDINTLLSLANSVGSHTSHTLTTHEVEQRSSVLTSQSGPQGERRGVEWWPVQSSELAINHGLCICKEEGLVAGSLDEIK